MELLSSDMRASGPVVAARRDDIREGGRRGTWTDEPDDVRWRDAETGLECVMSRVNGSGAWCGSVVVPESNPLHGHAVSTNIDVPRACEASTVFPTRSHSLAESVKAMDVHGPVSTLWSLAAGGRSYEWRIGFYCGQAEDMLPHVSSRGTYRDLRYVSARCRDLAFLVARHQK